MKYAVELKKQAQNDNLPYEQVWCVYDRDEHPNINEAHSQARDNNIEVAFSVPSFELWILLHFEFQSAYIERDDVNEKIQNHFPQYLKGKSYYQLSANRMIAIQSHEKGNRVFKELPPYKIAITRAEKLRTQHRKAYRETDANPSTTIDRLIIALDDIAAKSSV